MECSKCKNVIDTKERNWVLKEDSRGMGGDEDLPLYLCYECRHKLNI